MSVIREITRGAKCHHCGSTFILPDGDGGSYCLPCGRTYHDFRQYGHLGGLQTSLRYGSSYMAELGKKGGRPKLRQLQIPEAQNQIKEGGLPNRLSELKELWKQRSKSVINENGEAR